jgi:hypothetical protein
MAPLLTQQLSHEGEWECITCVDFYTETSPKPWEDTAAKCLMCENCIRNRFEQALEFEHHMPAAWGEEELDINDYAYALLDADFVLAYSTAWSRKLTRETSRPEDAAILAGEMPDGWELGRQYQRCPACLKAVQLLEACNHMTCLTPCRTDYCYICGREVAEDALPTHWTVKGCPQYGHPDDEDAKFAPNGDDEEGWQDNHGPTEEERWEILNADFDGFHAGMFLTLTWDVTMQTADERTRRIMTSILTLDEYMHARVETDEDIDWVLATMTQYRESYGVDRAEWNRILDEYSRWLRRVLTRPGGGGGLYQSRHDPPSPDTSGVLNQPVGGVFDIVSREGRIQAYEWAHARGMAWRAGTTERFARENFAIFVLGPGGTNFDHEAAGSLIDDLNYNGERLTHSHVGFLRAGMEGGSMRVEILPAAGVVTDDEANPLHDIRDWFLDPEPVDGSVWEEQEVRDLRLLQRNPQ